MKRFSQIFCQERAINFLKNVIKSDKIPHAYLFTGIEGIGKKTTALALAQAVNCREPFNGEGCGRCITCRQLENGNFPDYYHIEPDGQNIKIEQIRELNRSLNFKPVLGKYRITIIDKAEMMTEEASNSFLKTLEEPPPGNIIVLKVVDPLDLLPTIISRCQKVPFRPLPVDVIRDWLKNEMNQDVETALLAAAISEGSLGRAVDICEGGYLGNRREILSEIVRLPDLSKAQVLNMAIDLNKRYSRKGRSGADAIDLFELMGIWKTFYRDLILLNVKGPRELVINSDILNKLLTAAWNYNTGSLIDSFLLIDQSQRDLNRNPNIGLLMETMLLELKRLNGIQ